MKPADLQNISNQLADQRQQLLALARLLEFGVLLDAQSIAAGIARQITAAARELEARTKQLHMKLQAPDQGEHP